MADTLNESLVKVTGELKEANTRSLEATKELGKISAAQKGEYKEIGAAVKDAVGIDKLKDAVKKYRDRKNKINSDNKALCSYSDVRH